MDEDTLCDVLHILKEYVDLDTIEPTIPFVSSFEDLVQTSPMIQTPIISSTQTTPMTTMIPMSMITKNPGEDIVNEQLMRLMKLPMWMKGDEVM